MSDHLKRVPSVAVLSDIHGVLPALEAVLDEPAVRCASTILVLGDVAAGPQPNEVMQKLLSLGEHVSWVIGNADREMVELRRGLRHEVPDAIGRWAAQIVSEEHIQLLAALPLTIELAIGAVGRTMFCHATPRDDQEIVLVDSRYRRWEQVFADVPRDTEVIVCGHTHMPFVRLWRGKLVVNPGSVGMPYGRGGPHWALLGSGISLMRSTLDLDLACRRVCEASAFPGIDAWADTFIQARTCDEDAVSSFAACDGRSTVDDASGSPAAPR